MGKPYVNPGARQEKPSGHRLGVRKVVDDEDLSAGKWAVL